MSENADVFFNTTVNRSFQVKVPQLSNVHAYCQRVRPSGRPEGLTKRQIIEP